MSELEQAAKAAQAAEQIDPSALFGEDAGAGYDGMGASQFSPMYLRILHSDAKQLQEGLPEYVPGAKFGDFFNDLTGKVYGKSIDVVPLKSDVLWMEFKPNMGGFQGAHMPYSIAVQGDQYKGMTLPNGNLIIEYHVFYVLVVGEFERGIGIFSLKKTGIPHAKVWNTRIRQTLLPDGRIAPYYSSVWRLTTAINTNDKGQRWFTIGEGKTTNAERLRWVSKEDYAAIVKPFRKQVDSEKGAMQAALSEGIVRGKLTDNAGKEEPAF